MSTNSFQEGEPIVTEGATGTQFFILSKGKVRVSKKQEDGTEKELVVLREHSFFGERALVKREPRSASVTAMMTCTCYVLEQELFYNLIVPHAESTLEEEITRREMQKLIEAEIFD